MIEGQTPTVLGEFGRFVIQRRLGQGQFASVYQARDRQSGQLLALKLLKEETLDAASLERFKHEFRVLSHVEHENLVKLYDLYFHMDEHFFTMELVEGLDFLCYVRSDAPRAEGRNRPSSAFGEPVAARGASEFAACTPSGVERLRSALGGLASAVAAIHRAGLVHRDLKPANVRVTHEGRVVVLDYGLVADASRGAKGKTSAHVGTAQYMAPEQWEEAAAGPACDCYAIGVMLFQALTGQLPFSGSAQAMLLRKRTVSAPHPSLLVRPVPRDLDDLAADLLEVEPTRRPTAAQILERLEP